MQNDLNPGGFLVASAAALLALGGCQALPGLLESAGLALAGKPAATEKMIGATPGDPAATLGRDSQAGATFVVVRDPTAVATWSPPK